MEPATPHRYASAFTGNEGGWFSFLWMAGTEVFAPALAVGFAAVALIVVFALRLEEVQPWLLVSPLLAFMAANFWGWLTANRRLQALGDFPLSRIASAAQGYLRLEGRAASFAGQPTRSPLTQQVCCWYSYDWHEFDDQGHPKSQERDTSNWSFMLNDGSGECVVDPVGARLIPVRTNRWRDRNIHYVEKTILPGDPLVVMGQFSTSAAGPTDFDLERRTGELLAEWKKDLPALLRRFNLDTEDQLMQQWECVRTAALQAVRADLARNPPQAQNQMARPADGRPFIISAESEPRLERDLKIWAWLHLALFLAGGGTFVYWALALRP